MVTLIHGRDARLSSVPRVSARPEITSMRVEYCRDREGDHEKEHTHALSHQPGLGRRVEQTHLLHGSDSDLTLAVKNRGKTSRLKHKSKTGELRGYEQYFKLI